MLLMTMNNRIHSKESWIDQMGGNEVEQPTRRYNMDFPQQQDVNTASNETDGMRLLGPNFIGPGEFDVICARGGKARNHSGNRRFRELIQQLLDPYGNARTKMEKSTIVSEIIDSIRAQSPNGGFVKEIGGRFYEVGDHIAREKVGQSFRDLLHTKYKSSTKAKMAKRRMRRSSSESAVKADAAHRPFVHSSSDSDMIGRSADPCPIIEPLPMPCTSFPNTKPPSSASLPHFNKQPPIAATSGADTLLQGSLHSISDDKDWTNTGDRVQMFSPSADEHMNWEYGPISFSRFEQSLQANEVLEEKITASIFDLPGTETNIEATETHELGRLEVNHTQDQWGWGNLRHPPTPRDGTARAAFEQAAEPIDQSKCAHPQEDTKPLALVSSMHERFDPIPSPSEEGTIQRRLINDKKR